MAFKIQMGFWDKWDGEGEPTGTVGWEDEPNGGGFATREDADAALVNLCETCGYDPKLFRIVEVKTPTPFREAVRAAEKALASAVESERDVKARDGELDVGDDSLDAAIEAAEEAVEAAHAALVAAREAVVASDEPAIYTLRDGESGVEEVRECTSDKEARKAAREWIRGGDYGEVTSTIWVDCYLTREDGWNERVTVQIDPEEPECSEEAHDWRDDGTPGFGDVVRGNGGGVILASKCAHCGVQRVTDTWAQRPDTGEQGLTSVSYETGEDDES